MSTFFWINDVWTKSLHETAMQNTRCSNFSHIQDFKQICLQINGTRLPSSFQYAQFVSNVSVFPDPHRFLEMGSTTEFVTPFAYSGFWNSIWHDKCKSEFHQIFRSKIDVCHAISTTVNHNSECSSEKTNGALLHMFSSSVILDDLQTMMLRGIGQKHLCAFPFRRS